MIFAIVEEVIFGKFFEYFLRQCYILMLEIQQSVAGLSLAQIYATISRLRRIMSVNDGECFRFCLYINAMLVCCASNGYAGTVNLCGDADSGGIHNV